MLIYTASSQVTDDPLLICQTNQMKQFHHLGFLQSGLKSKALKTGALLPREGEEDQREVICPDIDTMTLGSRPTALVFPLSIIVQTPVRFTFAYYFIIFKALPKT